MSPTSSQPKENDWQIVMPLKNTSNSSDPASEKSQPEEDVFVSDDKSNIASTTAASDAQTLPLTQTQATTSTAITTATATVVSSAAGPTAISTSTVTATATTSSDSNVGSNAQPPPPPYSVAITRHLDNKTNVTTTASSTKTSTVTTTTNSASRSNQQQQQQSHDNILNDLDDGNGRPGILPAARARLASLKSLGSKKLNAIKMRLSDNRQKIEECK